MLDQKMPRGDFYILINGNLQVLKNIMLVEKRRAPSINPG